MMNHKFEYIKREKLQYTHYLVVVEFFSLGYIMAERSSAEEAKSLAGAIALHLDSNTNEDAGEDEIIKPYNVLMRYEMKGSTSFISNSVCTYSFDFFEVYVVGINNMDGGMVRFIRERENYSLLLSLDNLINKYEKLNRMFKDFVYCAN